MKVRTAAFWTIVTLFAALLLAGCSPQEPGSALKQVQQQRSGDYVITVLNDTGSLKKGANSFTLEFRKAADNQLADPGNVEVKPMMEMAGMAPMMATCQVKAGAKPGQFDVTTELGMAGSWKFHMTYGQGQQADIDLSAR